MTLDGQVVISLDTAATREPFMTWQVVGFSVELGINCGRSKSMFRI